MSTVLADLSCLLYWLICYDYNTLVFESQETCSSFPQEHWDISKCATQGDSNQACILAVGTIIGGIKAAHIVLEKKVLLWVTKLTDMVSFLFSMFFCL